MKSVWCLVILTVQTVICDYISTIHNDKDWRNIRREKTYFTLRGKRGICLPPRLCGRYRSNGSSNKIFEYNCRRIEGRSMVCCSATSPWSYDRPIHFDNPSQLSNGLPVSVRSTNFLEPYILKSLSGKTISESVSIPSVEDTTSSKTVQPLYKIPSPSTDIKSVSLESGPSVRFKRSFNSAKPFLSTRRKLVSSRSVASANYTNLPNLVRPLSSTVSSTAYLLTNNNSSTNSSDSLTTLPSSNASETSTIIPITSNVSTTSSNVSTTTSKVSTTTSSPNLVEEDYASEFPKPPVCGVSQGAFSRVVGGNNASLGDFPWIGVIAYISTGGFVFKCGASLITSQHSLTAAHCIAGFENRLYFVRLGELDLADHSQTRPVDAVVKTKIKHEKYNAEDGTNDIGVLVFYRRVIFTKVIRPICLPLSNELRSNKFVDYRPFIAGWGQTSYQGQGAAHLQMLQIPVVTQDRCKEAYAPIKFIVIDERVICAGGQGGKDACNGDSGGPLMQPIWDPTNYTTYFYQTGVVSMGMKCGTPGFPAIFTRVTEYIPWIQKHVLGTDSS